MNSSTQSLFNMQHIHKGWTKLQLFCYFRCSPRISFGNFICRWLFFLHQILVMCMFYTSFLDFSRLFVAIADTWLFAHCPYRHRYWVLFFKNVSFFLLLLFLFQFWIYRWFASASPYFLVLDSSAFSFRVLFSSAYFAWIFLFIRYALFRTSCSTTCNMMCCISPKTLATERSKPTIRWQYQQQRWKQKARVWIYWSVSLLLLNIIS